MNTVKELLKKLTSMLIVFTIMMAHCAVVGEVLVSYAIDTAKTNNDNVEILAYFENEQGEKVTEIASEIDKTLTLKIDVTVKNEEGFGGYFDGKINLKEEEIKIHVNAGETKTIEKHIVYENSVNDNIQLQLTGKYVNSKKEFDIQGLASVLVKWVSKQDTEAEMKIEVLTNKTYTINEDSKNILQVLAQANVKGNSYPVQDIQIEIETPESIRKVEEHKREGTDIIIITYELDENVNIEKLNGTAKLKLFDGKELTASAKAEVGAEKDGSITSSIIEKEEEIYKGKLYVKQEREYTSTTRIDIDYTQALEGLKIDEEAPVYITSDDEEKNSNIQYVSTKIAKTEFEKIFGQDGFIEIEDQDGSIVASLNIESQTDEDGFFVITYGEGVTNIKTIASKPITIGTLNIVNSKKIKEEFSREEVEKLNRIKEQVTVNEIKTEKMINLKETETVAEISLEKGSISAISEEEQILRMTAKFDTSDEAKELYKNPTLKITLPKEIKEIEVRQSKALYRNGLEIESANVNKNNSGNIEINISLSGEQKGYDNNGGLEVYLELKVDVDKLTPSKEAKIKMSYTNENKNAKKELETDVNFVSQYGLMVYSEVSNYNEADTVSTIKDDKITAKLEANGEKQVAQIKTVLVNNYSEEVKDIEILLKVQEERDIQVKIGQITPNKIDLINPGESVEITATVEIPENIDFGKVANIVETIDYTYINNKFTKSADLEFKTDEKSLSSISSQTMTPVATELLDGLKVDVITTSAGNELKDGDSVFEGQTVKYEFTITNNTGKDYSNLKISATQINGLVWDYIEEELINPLTGLVNEHFYRVSDKNEIDLGTIDKLANNESTTFKYEAVPNTLGENTELKTYGTIKLNAAEGLNEEIKTIQNNIQKADLKITIEDSETRENLWRETYVASSHIKVENISDKELNNIEIKMAFSSDLTIEESKYFEFYEYKDRIEYVGADKNSDGETIVTLKISKIEPNSTIGFYTDPKINEMDIEKNNGEISIIAMATINSNVYYSNQFTREYYSVRNYISVSYQALTIDGNKITKETVVNDGEIIKLIATVKNNEDKEVSIKVSDMLQEGLSFEKIELIKENEETIDITNQTLDDSVLNYEYSIDKNSKIQISINIKITENNLSNRDISNTLYITDMQYANNYSFVTELKANKTQEQEQPIEEESDYYTVSGTAWIDENKNGKRDTSEERIKDMLVRVINTETAKVMDLTATTSDDGAYSLRLEKGGKYIVIYMYDSEKYSLTTYQLDGISDDSNSDAVTRTINVNGNKTEIGATDEFILKSNLSNIDIGLVEKKNFDMKLEKFVEQITVTNSSGTKTYTFDSAETLAKVEIPTKVLKGSNIVVTYKFRVSNIGDTEGYVTNIVDYLPKALSYSSGVNPDWYQSGDSINNSSLSNTVLKPGESKEVKLVVTKTMTNSNTELVENRAEIEESKNSLGLIDKTEDNAKAEVLIGIRTGSTIGYIAVTLTIITSICGITYWVNRKYFNNRIRI